MATKSGRLTKQMTVIISLFLTVLVCSSAHSDASQAPDSASLCRDQELKNKVVDAGTSLETFNWKRAAKKNLLMIGDEHTYSDPSDIMKLANLYRRSSEARSICLFLEMPSSIAVNDFKEMLNRKGANPEGRRYQSYFKRIFDQAVVSGFKIVLADHPNKDQVTDGDRNLFMAKTIQEQLSNNCTHGVIVVGKAHASPNGGQASLPMNLRARGVSLTSINLQYAGERAGIDNPALESWNNLCSKAASSLNKAAIFENSKIAKMRIYPKSNYTITFDSFDYTAIFP